MDNTNHPRLSAATWLKSRYLLLLPLVAALAIWLLGWSDRHFVTDNQVEETVITLTVPVEEGNSGLPHAVTLPAGTRLSLLGHFSNALLVEDAVGRRFRIFVKPDDYTTDIAGNADNRRFDTSYRFYVKASDPEKVLIGENINDVIRKYGDYTFGDPAEGYYGFRYLTPMVNGVRHESGVALITDPDGTITGSRILQPEYKTSNFFHILPFYDTIVSWKLARGFNSLFKDKAPEPEEESKGFFGTIFGAIWSLIVGLFKFALLLVILGAIFIIPPLAIAAITGPLVHFRHIPTRRIEMINLILAIPLEYIIFVTLTDYFHQIWLLALPFFAALALGAMWIPTSLTTARRCEKCRAVDTIESTRTKLDERVRYEYQDRDYVSNRLKYKGYSLRRGRKEWVQAASHTRSKYKITETDYRTDWHCTACGASGTNFSTHTDRKLDGRVTVRDDRTWIRK